MGENLHQSLGILPRAPDLYRSPNVLEHELFASPAREPDPRPHDPRLILEVRRSSRLALGDDRLSALQRFVPRAREVAHPAEKASARSTHSHVRQPLADQQPLLPSSYPPPEHH